MPNTSDKAYLTDAIHLMENADLLDAELAAVEATVDKSKGVVVSAGTELERHRQWLERHREAYAKDLKRAQRQLRSNDLIGLYKQVARLPVRLVSSAGSVLFGRPRTETSRAKREQLQNRINSV